MKNYEPAVTRVTIPFSVQQTWESRSARYHAVISDVMGVARIPRNVNSRAAPRSSLFSFLCVFFSFLI